VAPFGQAPWLVSAVFVLLAFLVGLARGGFSSLGPLTTPLLTLVMPNVATAVGTLVPMFIAGDLVALRSYWRRWDGRRLKRPVVAATFGILAGTFLLVRLPVDALRAGLAIVTILAVGYKHLTTGSQSRLRHRPRPWHGWAAGAVSGVASAMFNAGAPPYNTYLLLEQLSPQVFVATSVIFFAVLNWIKLAILYLLNPQPGLFSQLVDVQLLQSQWWTFAFIPIGNWTGRVLVQRLSPAVFEGVISVLLLLTSALLLWQSW
jgi:uncharacterized membrane protein YfcA